jgi:hypothetical protein
MDAAIGAVRGSANRRNARRHARRHHVDAMPATRPALIESLRTRAEALRRDELSRQRSAIDLIHGIDRRLRSALRWLDEALALLEVIRPAVAHRFLLTGLFTLSELHFVGGAVSCRRGRVAGEDVLELVELGYRLANEAPLRLVVPPGDARLAAERLRASQLDYSYRSEGGAHGGRGGVFTVAQVVTASVRLIPDFERGRVVAALANVDRLESVSLEFTPDALGEPALEDLVRLILGDSDAFLKRAPLARVRPSAASGPSS